MKPLFMQLLDIIENVIKNEENISVFLIKLNFMLILRTTSFKV